MSPKKDLGQKYTHQREAENDEGRHLAMVQGRELDIKVATEVMAHRVVGGS